MIFKGLRPDLVSLGVHFMEVQGWLFFVRQGVSCFSFWL